MNILLTIIIAVSLSMDAFSLSLAYGTLGMNKKNIYLLSAIVGIFHFFMPLIGLFLGNKITNYMYINTDILVFIILGIIGMQMIIESFKEKNVKNMKIYEYFLFALAVSVDSFTVGLTLSSITNNYILSAFLFALSAFIFTFLGLLLGNKIKKVIGKYSTILGGITLLIIGILYLF